MSLNCYQMVLPDAPLDQGDIIFDCPVVGWKEGPVDLSEGGDAIGRLRDAQ